MWHHHHTPSTHLGSDADVTTIPAHTDPVRCTRTRTRRLARSAGVPQRPRDNSLPEIRRNSRLSGVYTRCKRPWSVGSGCSKNHRPHIKNHHDTRSDLAYTGLGTHPTRHCTSFPIQTAESTASPRGSRQTVVTGPTVWTSGATIGIFQPKFLVEVVEKGHGHQPVSTNLGQHGSGPPRGKYSHTKSVRDLCNCVSRVPKSRKVRHGEAVGASLCRDPCFGRPSGYLKISSGCMCFFYLRTSGPTIYL